PYSTSKHASQSSDRKNQNHHSEDDDEHDEEIWDVPDYPVSDHGFLFPFPFPFNRPSNALPRRSDARTPRHAAANATPTGFHESRISSTTITVTPRVVAMMFRISDQLISVFVNQMSPYESWARSREST